MERTGYAKLPLHYGRAPRYLFVRMQRMAREMVSIIVDEYGSDEFLKRISDPFWFQALGCVLGYDWHSSGVTTVLTGVLKNAVSPQQHGIAVCGGKGKTSRKAQIEISEIGEKFGFSTAYIETLRRASRLSAKVDNAAVQAGYQLYHHAFIFADNKKWAVVQQGMCAKDRTARRYHWLSESVRSYVCEPHSAIVGDTKRDAVLDMTAEKSEGCRRVSVDLVREKPCRLVRMLQSAKPDFQKSLSEWLPESPVNPWEKHFLGELSMPRSTNWKTIKALYEFQPKNYEELLEFKGVGPATVRGLALVADVIYGEKPSWNDPVKYSFAYGGKDGVPYPVDRKAMDESIYVLKRAVEEARIGKNEKMHSLKTLMKFLPENKPIRQFTVRHNQM